MAAAMERIEKEKTFPPYMTPGPMTTPLEDPTRARLMKDFDGEILDYLRKAEDPYPFEQRI